MTNGTIAILYVATIPAAVWLAIFLATAISSRRVARLAHELRRTPINLDAELADEPELDLGDKAVRGTNRQGVVAELESISN